MGRFIVIGGGGFVGTNLCSLLVSKGHSVTCVSRSILTELPRVEYIRSEIQLLDASSLVSTADCVVHLAHGSLPSTAEADPAAALDRAASLVLPIIDLCVRHGTRLTVISSGGTVYGNSTATSISEAHPTNPVSAYGITKLMVEKLIIMAGAQRSLNYAIVRLANPYGPWQYYSSGFGLIPKIMASIKEGSAVEIFGDGESVRDYVAIQDAAAAIILCCLSKQNLCLNVGGGDGGHSTLAVIAAVEDVFSVRVKVELRPPRGFDVRRNVLSIGEISRQLGWTPTTDFRTGLELLKKWNNQ